MKHFKPYVNLIHYKNTDQYVLNALISLPSEYSVIDQKQQRVDNNWVVSLLVKKLKYMKNSKKADILTEFSFNLESPEIKDMNKIKLEVKPYDTSTLTARNGTVGTTDFDPGDAEDDEMPET
jgi:hypothetical protein